MLDSSIIVLIAACLIVGGMIGAVVVLTAIGAMLHRAANASAIFAPAVPARPAGFTADIDPMQASAGPLADELDAADALDGFRTPQNGLQKASRGPTGDFRGSARVPGCGYCKRLRKAIFG